MAPAPGTHGTSTWHQASMAPAPGTSSSPTSPLAAQVRQVVVQSCSDLRLGLDLVRPAGTELSGGT